MWCWLGLPLPLSFCSASARANSQALYSAPELLKLDEKETALLKEVKLFCVNQKATSSGVAVQMIAAPASLIWDTILRYDQYKDWVKNIMTARSIGR